MGERVSAAVVSSLCTNAGSEIRNQVRESIWILLVEFCKNPIRFSQFCFKQESLGEWIIGFSLNFWPCNESWDRFPDPTLYVHLVSSCKFAFTGFAILRFSTASTMVLSLAIKNLPHPGIRELICVITMPSMVKNYNLTVFGTAPICGWINILDLG